MAEESALVAHEGQDIHVVEGADVATIKLRTSVFALEAIAVQDAGGAVGLVIRETVAPGVGSVDGVAVAEALDELRLERVVVGVEDGRNLRNLRIAEEGTNGVQGALRRCSSAVDRAGGDETSRLSSARAHLVDINDTRKMGALVAEVANVGDPTATEVLLDIEVPLLGVGRVPVGERGPEARRYVGYVRLRVAQARECDGPEVGAAEERRVVEDVVLDDAGGDGVVENSVSRADRGLAGLEGIPRKTEAGSEVGLVLTGYVPAVGRGDIANDDAVGRTAGAEHEASAGGQLRCVGGVVDARIEAGQVLEVTACGGLEVRVPESEAQGEVGLDAPFVLSIPLVEVQAGVGGEIERRLAEVAGRVSEQEIGEVLFVPRLAGIVGVVEFEVADVVTGGVLVLLVLVPRESELHAVVAADPREVVEEVVIAVEIAILSEARQVCPASVVEEQVGYAVEGGGVWQLQRGRYVGRVEPVKGTGWIGDDGAVAVGVASLVKQGWGES